MVQVERLDNATEIVTDPRFGPPKPSTLGSGHRQSDWLLMMLAIVLIFLLGSLAQSRQ